MYAVISTTRPSRTRKTTHSGSRSGRPVGGTVPVGSRSGPPCVPCRSTSAALALAGERAEARAIVAQLERRARMEWVDPGSLAVVRAALGERDAALRHLDQVVAGHSRWVIQLGTDPRFDPLRGDPRFEALLARVGLAGLRSAVAARPVPGKD